MKPCLRLSSFAAAGALLLAAQPAADEVRFRSVADTTLEKKFVQHSELELVLVKFKAETPDGPQEDEQDSPGFTIVDDETIEFTDETVEAGDGRPKQLVRSFETIDNSFEFKSEDEDAEDVTRKNKSGLLGKSIVFTWDEEEEEFGKAWKGDEGDDELLEAMVEDADFRGWLPGKAVDEGDTWSISIAEFNNLQEPSGSMGYQDEEAGDEEEDDPTSEQLRENLKGEIKATYKGTREEEGVQVGVIAFEGKQSSHGEHERDSEMGQSQLAIETSSEFEGELLWDLRGGHFRALTCDSKGKLVRKESSSFEHEGISLSFEQSQTFEGMKTYRFSCQAKKE